jgi:hypothetical protein
MSRGPGGSSLSVERSVDRPEGIQCVFGISNDTVPIIYKYLFVDVDPLAQKRQILRIEPASYYPDWGAESDSDHLGRSDPRSAGDFDPDIAPRSASLRNEHNEREPGALGLQISHFVGGLAFRLRIGTTGVSLKLFRGLLWYAISNLRDSRTSLVGQRGLCHYRRRRVPSGCVLGIRAEEQGDQRGPAGLV